MFLSDVRKSAIKNTLGSLFRVHEGEGKKMSILWLALFCTITANFLVWSVVQSTFIKRVGVDQLPYLYFASSIAILIGSIVYARFAAVYRKTTVMHLFNLVSGGLVLLSWYFLRQADNSSSGTALSLYIFFGVLGNSAFLSFIASQLWTVIGDVFSTSQGKRLYPLLGIAGTAAGMAAGLILDLLTPSLGTTNILLVGIGFMLVTSPIIMVFNVRYARELGWYLFDAHKEAGKSALKETLKYVFSSRFILALAAVVMLHWFFNRLFGFVFAEVADRAFPAEDAFTQFSGLYLLAGCAGSILFDSLFLNRILERIGLTKGMFFVSNVVTVLAISIFAFPLFPVVVGAYFVRDILLSIQINSVQVMTAILPDEHRAKVSAFLDGVVVTVGGALGGLLVLATTLIIPRSTPLEFEIRVIAVLILVLLAIRFAFNFYVRKEFFRILEENLVNGNLKTKQRAIETLVEHKYLKREGIGKLIDALKDVSEPLSVKEAVVRVLGQITDPTTIRVLIHQLVSEEPALRLAAARALAEFRLNPKQFYEVAFSRHHAIEELRNLFAREEDSLIRAAALDALIHLEDEEIVPFLLKLLQTGDKKTREDCVHSLRLFHDPAIVDDVRKVLEDKDPVIRGNAIVALWQFPWEREKLQRKIAHMIRARSEVEFVRLSPSLQEESRLGIKVVGDVDLLSEKPLLVEGLTWSQAPMIQTECALSLFKMGDPEGGRQVRKVLEGHDFPEIQRIRLLAKKRILDEKAGAVLQELIEETALEYPANVPSGERLARPLGMIPRLCLEKLQKMYSEAGEHEELKKIHTFLMQKKTDGPVRGTVLLCEPDVALQKMYTVGLLAYGFEVTLIKDEALPDKLGKETVIVLDRGGASMPDLKHFGAHADRVVVILGKSSAGTETDVAIVERQEGIVFRHHFAPSELVQEVEKKLR